MAGQTLELVRDSQLRQSHAPSGGLTNASGANLAIFPARRHRIPRQAGITSATTSQQPRRDAMNVLDPHLAHHEIDRRLRDAGHYRRISWGRSNRRIGTGRARRDCGESA
jgi:hypothetical protein